MFAIKWRAYAKVDFVAIDVAAVILAPSLSSSLCPSVDDRNVDAIACARARRLWLLLDSCVCVCVDRTLAARRSASHFRVRTRVCECNHARSVLWTRFFAILIKCE